MATFYQGEVLDRVIKSLSFTSGGGGGFYTTTLYTVPTGKYCTVSIFKASVSSGNIPSSSNFFVGDTVGGLAEAQPYTSSANGTQINTGQSDSFNFARTDSGIQESVVHMIEGQTIRYNQPNGGTAGSCTLTCLIKEFVAPGGLVSL